MTNQEIKITGQPTNDPQVCNFIVDQPVCDQNISIQFNKKEDGLGSELIEKLFEIDGITKVFVAGPKVSITKANTIAWPQIGKEIGQAIRAAIQSQNETISAKVIEKVKNWDGGELKEKIQKLFKERINPSLASHGGFVELSKIIDNDVYLKMGGGCQGCASSLLTLKQGIERAIQEAAPEVENIIDDTDHSAGENPYYS